MSNLVHFSALPILGYGYFYLQFFGLDLLPIFAAFSKIR